MNGKITVPLSYREKRGAESVSDTEGLVRPGAPANHRRKAPLYAYKCAIFEIANLGGTAESSVPFVDEGLFFCKGMKF